MDKIDRRYINRMRNVVQWAMLIFIVYGGWQFYRFVEHFNGRGPYVDRPELVEGFLPIGALMSLKVWVMEGVINTTHPAAMFILIAALLVSWLLMKSFCGWLCPVGTISELAHKLGAKALGRNFVIHKYLDYPLRSIKYLLLGFFAYIILWKMPVQGLKGFMSAPYWKVADVKMLMFFTDMSTTAAVVMGVLAALSLIYKNFWCRYLCPYGALTGLLGMLSPVKITRHEVACIDCNKCARACPNQLEPDTVLRVSSPECSGCMSCVGACPSNGALDAELKAGGLKLRPVVYAAAVALVFFGVIWGAMLGGHWHSDVSYEQYRQLVPQAGRLDHP